MESSINYPLDYNWEHPWPRAPIPRDEALRLKVLYSFSILDTPQETPFDILCELACNALGCPIAAISFIDRDRQWYKASVGLNQAEIPRDVAFCAHSLMNPKAVLVVKDTLRDKRFRNNPLVTRASSIRYYAGASIVSERGQPLGTLFVFDTKPHTQCNQQLLQRFAHVVGKMIYDRKMGRSFSSIPNDILSYKSMSPPPTTTAVTTTPQQPVPSRNEQVPRNTNNDRLLVRNNSRNSSQQHTSIVTTEGRVIEPKIAQPVASNNVAQMLMDLLARTTDTQQQLAAQQGVMFETLGSHTNKIDELTEKLSRIETLLNAPSTKEK